MVITVLKKVVSRKRALKFSVGGYDRLARLRARRGTPKLFSVRLLNFGIIFSDSIAIDSSKKNRFFESSK